MAVGFIILGIIVVLYILIGLKIVNQYERGVKFTLGKYQGIIKPGLRFVWPIFQKFNRIDVRTRTVDVPDQDAITKDNVSVKVNAVLYFRVDKAEKAVIDVEDFEYATAQLSQTTMRN